MKNLLLLLVLLAPLMKSCHNNMEPSFPKNQLIDDYLMNIMQTHSIPGMGIAVIKDGSVVHKGFYGIENLKTNKEISIETLFKVFSLTKTFVATGVFQLIEAGKISLNEKLSEHFENIPPKWKEVTIGNLLSHSSGLPDIRQLTKELENDSITDKVFVEMLYNDEMEFATNSQWNYNQTNYILLKMIIEKESNLKFEDFILKSQFQQSESSKVLFATGADKNITNQATYYDYDKETQDFVYKKDFSGKKNYPLAGINLTLDEYILWNDKLDANEHISEQSKSSMWTPFKFSDSDREFLYGWDVYRTNDFNSLGFSGGGVSGFRKFVDKKLTIIALTTGYKNYSVHNVIIDQVAGIVDTSLYNESASLTEIVMGEYFLENSSNDYSTIIKKVKEANPSTNMEQIFNSIGFTLFFNLDRHDDAINLFKLNALENPESFDAYGSLAYLYYLTEKYELARENYVKAYDLNPENNYSERRIKEIDTILKEQ